MPPLTIQTFPGEKLCCFSQIRCSYLNGMSSGNVINVRIVICARRVRAELGHRSSDAGCICRIALGFDPARQAKKNFELAESVRRERIPVNRLVGFSSLLAARCCIAVVRFHSNQKWPKAVRLLQTSKTEFTVLKEELLL
jgi:hypothetical protein